MCRASWKNDTLLNQLDVETELDAAAIQIYLDWLYTSVLQIPATYSRITDAFNLLILKLWVVASAVEDKKFEAIVITTFFNETQTRFWTGSIKWAFVKRNCNDEIRNFILSVSLADLEPGWFSKEGDLWPDEYIRELADFAMVNWTERKRLAELRKMWMEKISAASMEEEEESFVEKKKGHVSTIGAASGIWRDSARAACLDRTISGVEKRAAGRQHSGYKVDVKKHSNRAERWQMQDMIFPFGSPDDGLAIPRSGG
mgnify:CR=1 FL=1